MVGSSRKGVLILGLDGMAFSVLDPLLARGIMPRLADLQAGGARTVLRSAVPPVTPPAWSTFLTGTCPGTHGILDFRRFDARSRTERLNTSRDLRRATLFRILSEAGRTVGVIHLPMHYPPPRVNGFVVSGHETPGRESRFTWPPELREEVLRVVPDYPFHVRVQRGYETVPEVFRETIGRVRQNLRARGDLAVHFLRNRPPDVLLVQLQSLDALLHFAFGFLDGRDRERYDLTVSCFAEADRQIGRTVDAAGERLVVALSDHGFGSLLGKVYPNVLLHEWGLLRLAPGVHRRRHGPLRRLVEATPLRALPAAARERKKRRKARRGRRGKPEAMREARAEEIERVLPLDWSRTKAYCPTAGTHALVYVNREGREPEGIVSDGEFEALRDELIERFRDARARGVSGPLFTDAKRAEEVWGGGPREEGPDLVLFPAEGWNAHRDLLRRRTAFAPDRRAGGTHRMEGVLFLAGPGVAAGTRDFPANIADVAPSVLRYLDVPVPEDMEGSTLEAPFTGLPPLRTASPLPPEAGVEAGTGFEEEEARELTERLRGLGYL